jgi:peptide/nickel transport system substrate-binding protein
MGPMEIDTKEKGMHRFDRRLGVAAVALVLAVAALAAVSLGASSSGGVFGVANAQATNCKQYGTLSYGIAGAGIPALDPNTISFAGQEPLQTLLYNGLTKYASNGSVQPDLATKWASSKDLKTWTFTLRHDVKYATGRPFTSADAVANIRRVLDPAVASGARGNIASITSVTASSKYQIRIKLNSPNAILPAMLIDVKMSDTANLGSIDKTGNGTGPYKVTDFVPDQNLTVVPNPNYFGPKPCLNKIVFVRQPDPTAMVTNFTASKLGMIWQVPPTSLRTVQADKNAFILAPRGISTPHVWEVDTTSPPFDNVYARQALSYAIDRKTMAKAAFFGTATPSLANSLLNPNSPGYDKALKPYTFDLAKAKQLFDKAGVKSGTTFTFWALANRRNEWITMAEILQQDLQKIGLNISIQRSDVSTWLGKFYPPPKKFPNTIVATFESSEPDPSLGLIVGTSGVCDCNWNNKQYDALYVKALGTTDPVKRQAIYNQMQQLFSVQAPISVLAFQTNIVAAQKGLVGAWEDPAGNVHLEDAHFVR